MICEQVQTKVVEASRTHARVVLMVCDLLVLSAEFHCFLRPCCDWADFLAHALNTIRVCLDTMFPESSSTHTIVNGGRSRETSRSCRRACLQPVCTVWTRPRADRNFRSCFVCIRVVTVESRDTLATAVATCFGDIGCRVRHTVVLPRLCAEKRHCTFVTDQPLCEIGLEIAR